MEKSWIANENEEMINFLTKNSTGMYSSTNPKALSISTFPSGLIAPLAMRTHFMMH